VKSISYFKFADRFLAYTHCGEYALDKEIVISFKVALD